jgi:CubicO group peptidase (beta-lactamase class C family)
MMLAAPRWPNPMASKLIRLTWSHECAAKSAPAPEWVISAVPFHPLRLAILLVCICWPAGRPALAQIGACPQTASDDIVPAPPEHVGMRSGPLAEALKSLRGKDRDIHALVVLRNCKMVVELYSENVTREHNHALYSVTKSILATLVGVLLKSGRLSSLDVSVADIVAASTKLEADKLEKARRIRLRDVMSMASGLEYHDNPTSHPIYGAADRLQFALDPALVHEPGKRYNYSNGDASIADAVVAAAAGKDVLSYGNEVLFAPLGFKNVEWWFRDKAGRYPGGWGLRLRAIDMAKFGQLYLQKGRWRNKAIIDAGFISEAWRPSSAATDYGLFWWRWSREEPWIGPVQFANGTKGQRIFVVPKHNIVIALSANISHADAEEAYPALVRAVVSAVQSNGPINQSVTDANKLAEELHLPFSGKPGNPVSKSGQDVPRLPK